MDITKFNEKFNKLNGNVYTVEEVVKPIDGAYEGELEHDNVEVSTINIYTKSKLTGTKINTYTTSTPSLTPWKTIIKIFSTEPVLYITYETTGDTVEAEDINNVQAAINITQEEVNDEIDRATDRENTIENNLNTEISRAENKETEINNNLNTEISRAKKAESDEVTRAKASEKTLTDNLNLEISRAKASESTLTDNLNKEIERAQKAEMDEVTRAKSAEKIITDNLTEEVNRASSAEGILTDNLNDEITRAKDSENTLNTNLTNEINRAKSAENTLTTNLATEVTRAINAENSIKNTINTNKPLWDDKYTKAEIDNKINEVITDLDWKESVTTFSDLSTNYPSPQDGWTVNVKDTDITYRWDGSKWISISANAIPLATSSIDGKMSKTDKSFLDTVKGLWNSVTNHINDAVKHITSSERTLWNTVSNKLDKSGGVINGKVTVLGSAQNNPFNVRGINGIMDDGNGNFESSDLYLNYNTTNKVYVNGTNEIYHKGNLTKVSQLTNDAGYITQADVDISQNHTHANKATLDKITESNLTDWNNKLSKSGGSMSGTISWDGLTANKDLLYATGSTDWAKIQYIINSPDNCEFRNQIGDDVSTKFTWYGNNTKLMDLQPTGNGTTISGADLSINGNITATNFNGTVNGFTLGKTVPANAVFTDTNTWRGVQDNLTSTATDQSLSANQGKVLKDLVDGKINSSEVSGNTGNVFGKIPRIGNDGVIELGRYIDFHIINPINNDYDIRLEATTTELKCTKPINANLNGNATTATRATQDSDGKQINTTYVKKGMTWNQLEGV